MKIYPRIFYITIFIILIFLPVILTGNGISIDTGINEKRVKIVRPVFKKNIVKYIKEYNKYFLDNFTGRDYFISRYNNIKFELFHETTVPDRVLIGKDNFLFYSSIQDGNSIADYQGIANLDPRSLDIISKKLSDLSVFFKNNNIKFYFVIAPNKETIYPEKLPDNIVKGVSTTADQVVECLKKEKINFIDLRNVLLSEKLKIKYEMFYRTDTHWNNLGAYVGYKSIANVLKHDFSTIEPVEIDIDNPVLYEEISGGDLYTMMGVKRYKHFQYITLKYDIHYKYIKNIPDGIAGEIITESDGKLPRAIIYRDSFAVSLQPLLSNNFSYVKYIWSHKIDRNLILNEKPDIVIIESVERNVKNLHGDHML